MSTRLADPAAAADADATATATAESGPAAPAIAALGYDRAGLDVQYSPSSCVPSLQAYLDEYAALSATARQIFPVRTDLRYGPLPEETLDFFPSVSPDAPVHVFVHGGNWQALGKDDSAFAAPAFLCAGAAFAAVNYGLAPHFPLDEIVAMVRRAIRWLHAQAGDLGFDPRRIHLSGSSAGAHLVAMALAAEDVGPLVAGATLLSGIYDLEPVRHSYVNDALHLDAAGARRNSPIHLPLAATWAKRPLVIARGGNETAEYKRQHAEMVGSVSRRGPVLSIVSPRRDHFDLPYELGDPATMLGSAVLHQMGLDHMDLHATAVAE